MSNKKLWESGKSRPCEWEEIEDFVEKIIKEERNNLIASNENNFVRFVEKTINEHPDWMNSTIHAIQLGIEERLNSEMSRASDLEVGFMHALDMSKTVPVDELTMKGLKAMRNYSETPWHEKIMSKF